MSMADIEKDFRDIMSQQVRLLQEGVERYRVFTPFLLDGGDHLAIVLKKEEGNWVLSDEAHTFMRLTYDIDEADLLRGTRYKIIIDALSMFNVEDRGGELILPLEEDNYGHALFSFVQALLKVTNVSWISREYIRSIFKETLLAFVREIVPSKQRTLGWFNEELDPDGTYSVDCYVEGSKPPILIHALSNDNNTRDATIALHQFEKWEMEFHSLAIFEDQESINRKVLARFTDIGHKQYSSFNGNRDRIQKYLSSRISE